MVSFKHDTGSEIYVLRSSFQAPLIAIGNIHSVEVFYVTDNACSSIACFHIGTRITSIAWGNSTSPEHDDWSIELAVASADFSLHLLTKSYNEPEKVYTFGGGLTGHHGRINDLAFCGGRGLDSWRYLATVSDDKTLMVWDLLPTSDRHPPPSSPQEGNEGFDIDLFEDRSPPTAYAIPFKYPLLTVCAHPSTSKDLLVADSRGSIYLTDWRTEPNDRNSEAWHHPNVLELVDPQAMADSALGFSAVVPGSLAWRRDNSDIIGAVTGSKFSLWDLSKLSGGKPNVSVGRTFSQGAHRFRWCQNHPDYFAISAKQSRTGGATINVYNTSYPSAHPTTLDLGGKPQYVHDFDFISTQGSPRLAAAVSGKIIVSVVN